MPPIGDPSQRGFAGLGSWEVPWKLMYTPPLPPFDPNDPEWKHAVEGAAKMFDALMTKLTGDPTIDEMLKKCISTLETKGNDYTAGAGNKDRLYNFRTAAELLGISIRQAWGVYAYKHWTSILRYVKEGRVESEPIEGRILDMVNYLLLLACIVAEEKKTAEQKRNAYPTSGVLTTTGSIDSLKGKW